MSHREFLVPGEELGVHRAGLTKLSLNEVFQKELRQLVREAPVAVIFRCQSLPLVEGERSQWEEVARVLVALLASTCNSNQRLFLHVDCEEEKEKSGTATIGTSTNRYEIGFHTNFAVTREWINRHEEGITYCRQLLSILQAGFTVNHINQSGRLFSISLPGKL